LTNNQSGCRITIIDKNTEAVKASLKEVFVNDIHKYHIDLITSEFSELIGGRDFSNNVAFAEYLYS